MQHLPPFGPRYRDFEEEIRWVRGCRGRLREHLGDQVSIMMAITSHIPIQCQTVSHQHMLLPPQRTSFGDFSER